jgi:hypothetical protein
VQTLPQPPVKKPDAPPCPVIPLPRREDRRFDAAFTEQLRIRGLLPPAS